MLPTSQKNRKLVQQYPFLENILGRSLPPHGPSHHPRLVDDLKIKVEVADGDLMFRRPDTAGIDLYGAEANDSFLIATEGPRKGEIGRMAEYLFLVLKNGTVMRFSWLDPSGKSSDLPRHPRDVFWGKYFNGSYSKPLEDEAQYLVWVTITAWYTDTRSDEPTLNRFGALQQRSKTVTIYREPKQGFGELVSESSELDHLRLRNSVFYQNFEQTDRVITNMAGRLDELCELFVDDVWRAGLLDIFNGCKQRGMSGKLSSTSMRLYQIAGRNVVTLEDEISQITFKGDSSLATLGIHSMDGTLPQLRRLVKRIVKQWQMYPEWRNEVHPDENVGIL